MIKTLLLTVALAIILLSAGECGQKASANKYKGRFEIKGICSNYTIGLIEGNMDTSMIVSSWTDENTGIKYSNVFALANPCEFPPTLNQGDEFYFIIDTAKPKECMVCMAYYPKPSKALAIKIVDK
jgi:hypothetical protein